MRFNVRVDSPLKTHFNGVVFEVDPPGPVEGSLWDPKVDLGQGRLVTPMLKKRGLVSDLAKVVGHLTGEEGNKLLPASNYS